MGRISISQMPSLVKSAYDDFRAGVSGGSVLIHNTFTKSCLNILMFLGAAVMVITYIKGKRYKEIWTVPALILLLLMIPLGINIIMIIVPGVYYHLLMKLQWVLIPVVPVVLIDRYMSPEKGRKQVILGGISILCAFFLLFDNGIRSNIAYFNMNQQYEKAYAYCLRLADRIEQTEGYYMGIPIAMSGMMSEESYPDTDITADVTSFMIGTNGNTFLGGASSYLRFFKSFLNITINLVDKNEAEQIFASEEYQEMQSFPAKDSIRVVDGIMYIKME